MSHQAGWRRQIVIPEFVMHGLEIPFEFPGLYIHRHQRIPEEVAPGRSPRKSWRLARSLASRDAALFIHRESERPHVVSRAVFPALALNQVSFPGSPGRGMCEIPRVACLCGRRIMHIAKLPAGLIQWGPDMAFSGAVEMVSD